MFKKSIYYFQTSLNKIFNYYFTIIDLNHFIFLLFLLSLVMFWKSNIIFDDKSHVILNRIHI